MSLIVTPMLQFSLFDVTMSFQVFTTGVDRDIVVLNAARASRLENQDAINIAIVSLMADPKEVLIIYVIFPFCHQI